MTSTPYPIGKVVPGHPSQRPVCFAWKEDPAPGCPRRGCRYEHICYLCSKDARVPILNTRRNIGQGMIGSSDKGQ